MLLKYFEPRINGDYYYYLSRPPATATAATSITTTTTTAEFKTTAILDGSANYLLITRDRSRFIFRLAAN